MGIARRIKKYHRKDWLLIRYREAWNSYKAMFHEYNVTKTHLGD